MSIMSKPILHNRPSRVKSLLAALTGLLLIGLPASAQNTEVTTVPFVDLNLYKGTWHEIASFPMMFQNSECEGTTATYTLNPDKSVKVWNQCYVPDGQGYRLEHVEGRARPVDDSNSKLKVQFFWPFEGDYWVIALDDNYQYAMVGHPSRDYLWILSRDRVMDAQTYQMLLDKARSQGFDISRLRQTPPRS